MAAVCEGINAACTATHSSNDDMRVGMHLTTLQHMSRISLHLLTCVCFCKLRQLMYSVIASLPSACTVLQEQLLLL
jgi:hypothetical protein